MCFPCVLTLQSHTHTHFTSLSLSLSLSLTPTHTRARARLGLWTGAVGDINQASNVFTFRDAMGADEPIVREIKLGNRYGEPYTTVRRGDLTRALLEALPGDPPIYNTAVIGVAADSLRDGGVRLQFKNGSESEEVFDCIVGADGIDSQIRRYVSATSKLVRRAHVRFSLIRRLRSTCSSAGSPILLLLFSSRIYMQVLEYSLTNVPIPQVQSKICEVIAVADATSSTDREHVAFFKVVAEERPDFTVYLDPACTLILARVAPGKIMWGCALNDDLFDVTRSDNDAAIRSTLQAYLDAATPPPSAFVRLAITACLAATPSPPDSDALFVWRLRDLDAVPSYARGRVAIIGDAAHASLPWTGLGISAAALDAQRLADALAKVCTTATTFSAGGGAATKISGEDEEAKQFVLSSESEENGGVVCALREYDADRRPRGHSVQQASRASDGGQGPTAYSTGRVVLRVIPLKVRTRLLRFPRSSLPRRHTTCTLALTHTLSRSLSLSLSLSLSRSRALSLSLCVCVSLSLSLSLSLSFISLPPLSISLSLSRPIHTARVRCTRRARTRHGRKCR